MQNCFRFRFVRKQVLCRVKPQNIFHTEKKNRHRFNRGKYFYVRKHFFKCFKEHADRVCNNAYYYRYIKCETYSVVTLAYLNNFKQTFSVYFHFLHPFGFFYNCNILCPVSQLFAEIINLRRDYRRRFQALLFFADIVQNVDTAVNAELACVEAQVVVSCIAPLHVSKNLIV